MSQPERETDTGPTVSRESLVLRWLLPLGGVLALTGYFGPWVDHLVSGLVITGLDLPEYVKFLPPVRSGQIQLWREGFFIPLLSVSLAFSLHAYARQACYPLWAKVVMIAIAIIAALNMLPPAWSPALLLTAEFRLQTIMLAISLAAVAFSPVLAQIPATISSAMITLLATAGILLPVSMFMRVLPTITTLYRSSLQPGWGMYVMVIGLVVLIAGSWTHARD